MKKYPSEEQERFIVRMPNGMRDQLKKAATASKRSMNAEIVARLEQSFEIEAFRGGELESVSAGVDAVLLSLERAQFELEKVISARRRAKRTGGKRRKDVEE